MGSNEGADDEKPVHTVYLEGFYIDKYEVTVAQYRKCVEAGQCKEPDTGTDYNWGQSGRDDHPNDRTCLAGQQTRIFWSQ